MAGKFIIIAGGTYSGTGKGVAVASIALLMRLRGFSTQIIKFDPYLNVNAGILAPSQHGECYLCDDGTETDLDLGHYERIAGVAVSSRNICTSGTLYKELINKQEKGDYLGQTVQIIPHLTDSIQERLVALSKDADIVLAEIGGTVGDMESSTFYEAIRQFKQKNGSDVVLGIVSPIIWNAAVGEPKSKPLQTSVRQLNSYGLHPDMVLCRWDTNIMSLNSSYFDKIANLTGVPRDGIFLAPDVKSIYHVPLEFYDRHVDDYCSDLLHLKRTSCRIHKHRDLLNKPLDKTVKIGVFGKYANSHEAYISLNESLNHAGYSTGTKVEVKWMSAEDLEGKDDAYIASTFDGLNGIIVPGGFDKRGVEGKIRAIRYARENKIPFLGICLGLQCAVIEIARNLCGMTNANSLEFDKDCTAPVVHYVKGQENIDKKSGTMRLGAFDCELTKGSLAMSLYGKKTVSERHRHRLEVNPAFKEEYAKQGFHVSGGNPANGLIEIMELDRSIHPFFIGTQAHPEFKSKLSEPAPLFLGLVTVAVASMAK
jgi:CTP synthase